MNEQKMYHIAMTKEDAGEFALLTGDPGRTEAIASRLDNPRFVASNREYVSYLGTLGGARVNVISTGIGGPSTAIAVEELCKLGVKNFIRLGTCGGIDLSVKAGDVIIASAAVRQEGTGSEYLPLAFPAAADFETTRALADAAKALNIPHHIGIIQSKDSFYGQHEPERMPVYSQLLSQWETYKRAGVLGSEMECATLFLLGSALRVRTGAALLCVWNAERREELGDVSECHDTEVLYGLAVEAIKKMFS